jgi:hypothetical protein
VHMKRVLLLAMLFCFSLSAWSQPYEVGEVTNLQIHKGPDSDASINQRFFVKLSGTISEPTCTTSDFWYGYLDSDAGRAQYSAILASSISGKPIKINANDTTTCLSNGLLIRNVFVVW